MVDTNTLKILLEKQKSLWQAQDKISQLCTEIDAIHEDISDMILTLLGVPKDTTVELGFEKGFCRDWYDAAGLRLISTTRCNWQLAKSECSATPQRIFCLSKNTRCGV